MNHTLLPNDNGVKSNVKGKRRWDILVDDDHGDYGDDCLNEKGNQGCEKSSDEGLPTKRDNESRGINLPKRQRHTKDSTNGEHSYMEEMSELHCIMYHRNGQLHEIYEANEGLQHYCAECHNGYHLHKSLQIHLENYHGKPPISGKRGVMYTYSQRYLLENEADAWVNLQALDRFALVLQPTQLSNKKWPDCKRC